MITTKAYITKLPEDDSNIYEVNVPLMSDNVSDEALFEAIVNHSPGIYNGYEVGDCVIVTFEDDKYNTAIIIGKLFTEIPEQGEPVYGLFDQLNVTGSVVLPENTKIGNYTPQDFYNLYEGIENIDTGVDPEELKPFVKWNYTPRYEEAETDDDPTIRDYQISAEGVRLDHVHWEAPGIEKDEDTGQYVRLPEPREVMEYAENIRLQNVHYEVPFIERDSEGGWVEKPKATDMYAYADEGTNLQMIQYDAIGDPPEYGEEDTRAFGRLIITMSGEDYDNTGTKDVHTYYFLNSVPPSEENL